ncbi:MAG: ABC transporter ATP-binding protein [Deltaproteobacteria bacterium]|nr:ABC transporter ATP-binding protein [Deltaproteobacteria bacterium]
MIRLADIRYQYPDSNGEWALQGIDLTVDKGEYLLLCGGSGSGKSTLGYLLNGLIPHFFGGTLRGRVSILGRDTADLTVEDLFSTVGLVFQNTDAQLFNSSVENEIAFGLESLGRQASEIESEIRRTAAAVGIGHLLDRSPTALSGGEKRLVAIASVLSLAPPILVLDEPLAHLDWQGAERVRKILCRLHRQGATVVVIEQRVEAMLTDATRCVVMDRGSLLFDGSPSASGPVLRDRHLVPRYPAKPGPKPAHKQASKPAHPESEPLLRVRNIRYEMDHKPILHDVSLRVKAGEILAVVGPNGSGKTTLVRHFNGLLRPRGGDVVFMGKKIGRAGPSDMAGRIGISFQNPNDQFFKNSVADELNIGLKLSPEGAEGRLGELCIHFHLNELLGRSPYRLSEGQKKRVSVASILAMGPKLLVLDEPTVGQDGRSLESLAGLLLSLGEKGVSIVVVTHDLEFALAAASRWVVVHEGRVVGTGAPRELARDESLMRMGALYPMGRVLGEGWTERGGSGDHGH